MDVNKLLRPKKIAIIGASEKENLGGLTVRMFIDRCQARWDDVYLVNPKRDKIFNKKCYHSVSELPEKIDLVVIATPKSTVEELLRESVKKGAKAAVVYASGYGETGNQNDIADEESLKKLCIELDIALMGPNCAGYINFVDRVFPFGFIVPTRDKPGKVGLIAQSGQVCMSLLDSPKADYSYLISCGNSKIVKIEDYLEFLVNDAATKVVAAYIEGITQPDKFVKVLKKAVKIKKPVVILKAGRSEKAAKIAASHTGSMSGSDKSYDALFRKYGVIRVADMEELVGVSSALSAMPTLPKKNAFASVSASGGETTISADVSSLFGLNFPDFEIETIEKLKNILPSYSTPRNPLDTTAMVCYDPDIYASVLDTVLSDVNVEMLVIGFTIGANEDNVEPSVEAMTKGIEQFMASGNTKPVAILPFIESGRAQKYIYRLAEAGVPVLPPPIYAYKIIKYILEYSLWLQKSSIRTLSIASPNNYDGDRVALSEHESKKLLKDYGVNVSNEAIATSSEQAVKLANEIGYPIVMKIESSDILHKSDAGGVKLNVKNAEEVEKYYSEILENAKAYKADAKINGVLVQEMLPKGMEVIIGVNTDPQFGPMVLFGTGGIFVEVFKDVSLYSVPFGRAEALEMINSLKSSKMFYGYRGQDELDVDALADTLVAVSNFAVDNKDTLLEMDINPLFVYPKGSGVSAADGLIVLKR